MLVGLGELSSELYLSYRTPSQSGFKEMIVRKEKKAVCVDGGRRRMQKKQRYDKYNEIKSSL